MFQAIFLAVIALIATYLYRKLQYKRFEQHAGLPQLYPSLLLGHLKKLDAIIKRGAPDRHPDYIFEEMLYELDRPPLMFVDFRPVNRPMVLITSHEIAEQVTKSSKLFPTSLPKSDLSYMHHLTGRSSILLAHGDEWKALRRRYSQAFAPQHLLTLLPCILDKTSTFVQRIDALADSGQDFPILNLAINLTVDIIGAVIMDVDLQAQSEDESRQSELAQLYVELFQTYWDDKADWPWWLTPHIELKRRRLGKRVDVLLRDMIRSKHAEQQALGHGQMKSILSLSLSDTKELDARLVQEASDQIKTFLLAGHDTTSITLAWALYLISRTPRVLSTIRKELDDVLGCSMDPDSVRNRLLSVHGPDLIQKMTYISAVLKETLRLYPPAATARYAQPGTGFTVQTPDGESHCLDGMIIYNAESQIQRDPSVYGDTADVFMPERWLDNDKTSKIPPGAWRPFERGPRGCIGQDFALIELRIILAMIASRFDFIKVGLGELVLDVENRPILDDYGVANVKSQVYNTRQVNSKPVDGMRMRVQRRSE
jgi:cytochrome P450